MSDLPIGEVGESVGFFDAVCPKCRARIGWSGRAKDRPACHRCGHQIPKAELEEDARKIEEHRQMLRDLRTANPGWERWREARVAAGLTLRQAAKILDVDPSWLSAVERGERKPTEILAGKMIRCYGSEE